MHQNDVCLSKRGDNINIYQTPNGGVLPIEATTFHPNAKRHRASENASTTFHRNVKTRNASEHGNSIPMSRGSDVRAKGA